MQIIDQTILFVKEELQNAEGGHDWFHIERVYKNALQIATNESCDLTVVKLGALLHDIADSKFHPDASGGDEEIGPQKARSFLVSQNVSEEVIEHVVQIIKNISFKGGNFEKQFTSKELEIVQDADRLDAIGKPLLYRVTDEFLDAFQLEDLKELPELPQTRANSEELFEGE